MRRISCPKCSKKFKLLSAGNTDGATYEIAKRSRKGGGQRLKKITNGSKFQMVLSCGCKTDKSRTLLTIVGRSKAHAITMLRRWRAQQEKILLLAREAVIQ